MNISKREVVSILFIAIILLVGVLFGQLILNEIIRPMSLAAWVLLRIFVLSIDQKLYWGAIIIIGLIILFRILSHVQITIPSDDSINSNAVINRIEYWCSLFRPIDQDVRNYKTLKQELAHLLLSLYASNQRTSTNFRLYEALQRGEIPLPEHIHTFLFPEEVKKSRGSLKKFIHDIRQTPPKWIRRWTGKETAEHYQMIDEVLGFMETNMEMKKDNGKFTQN